MVKTICELVEFVYTLFCTVWYIAWWELAKLIGNATFREPVLLMKVALMGFWPMYKHIKKHGGNNKELDKIAHEWFDWKVNH